MIPVGRYKKMMLEILLLLEILFVGFWGPSKIHLVPMLFNTYMKLLRRMG